VVGAPDCAHPELELPTWPEPARLVAIVDFHGNRIDRLEA
jgi:hypothetical protein